MCSWPYAGTDWHLPHAISVRLAYWVPSQLKASSQVIIIKIPSQKHTLFPHIPKAGEEFVDQLL